MNKLMGQLDSTLSLKELAQALASSDWSLSFEALEMSLKCSGFQLTIEQSSPVLIHGQASLNSPLFKSLLEQLHKTADYLCIDLFEEDGRLIKRFQ